MDIETFRKQFGDNRRLITDVMQDWKRKELADLVRQWPIRNGELVGVGVIGGDALVGGSLLDDLPIELQNAMAGLQPDKFTSLEAMRDDLARRISTGAGGFHSIDNQKLVGATNWLKGRIGEDLFQEQVGGAAHLADTLNQEGWDVSIRRPDGLHDYVQVKLYSDPQAVVEKMLEVQKKVADHTIAGIDHVTPVDHIYFAVPADITDEVRRLAEKHPELNGMLYETSIPVDADAAGALVTEGLNNVGPEQLSHFFEELIGGAVIAGSLHAAVNGFLWYKGAREFEAAVAATTADTALSTAGLGVGLVAETVFDSALLAGPLGIGARVMLSRMARSRWNFAEFLQRSNAMAEQLIGNLNLAGASA